MTFRRALPFLIVLVGGALALHALLSLAGASIPYPDPTPALLAQQQADLTSLRFRVWVGVGVLLVGLVLAGIHAWITLRRR
jgi:hypothetical protein